MHPKRAIAKAGNAAIEPDYSHIEEIIVVCKTHFDIGYTHRVKDLLRYYRTSMIDKAMDIMDESKALPAEQQFVWTGPGWVMAKVVEDWPGQTPKRRRRINDYFKGGKFVTHALPFTVEADLMDPEMIARSYESASFVSRKYGRPLPRDAKMTDVPSHGGILATALAHGGVSFMHIGCNWPSGYVKFPHTPLFWWEGPDKSRVMTFYSSNYGTATGFNWPHNWGGNDPAVGRNLIPPKDWPYKVWVAIMVTGDNSGPPTAKEFKEIFEEAKEKLPNVKIRMGRMEDFADAIVKSGAKLPVVKGEMPDTWVHGCMCDPGGMKAARNMHALLPAAEALNTQLRLWGVPVADPAKKIVKACEQIVLYSEHTWGGCDAANQYGKAFRDLPQGHYKDLEASWEDKTDYIRTAATIINPLMKSNLAALARNVKGNGKRIVVYNPLPWTRSGIVEIAGKNIFVKDVPPSGYKTLSDTSDKSDMSVVSDKSSLENEFLRIAFDPGKGTIASLVDKRTGREWVDAAAVPGLGQYLNERFTFEQTLKYTLDYQQGRALHAFKSKGDWPHPGMHKGGMITEKQVPYRAASPANGTLKVIRDGIAQSATLEMPANPANHLPGSALRVTLYEGQPYVDLEITLKDKAKDNWPEADWLCLPFKVRNPAFRVGRALGMMNPATDILPGANRDIYAVGSGVTLTDADGSGVAVCPLDAPLISLDRPGCWKFSTDFVPKKPIVYLNLYNNQWNTNYRYWYPGTFSSRVRLWILGRNATVASALVTPALEARLPLLAVAARGKGGALPAEQAGIAVSRKGIQITAFGTDFNGNPGTLLRIWEQGGVSGNLTIALPAGNTFTTAQPVNLRGEKTGTPIKIKRGMFSFNLHAYGPASYILV